MKTFYYAFAEDQAPDNEIKYKTAHPPGRKEVRSQRISRLENGPLTKDISF